MHYVHPSLSRFQDVPNDKLHFVSWETLRLIFLCWRNDGPHQLTESGTFALSTIWLKMFSWFPIASTHQVGDQNLPDGPSKSNDMHVLVDFWDCYYDIPSPEITLQLPTLNSQLSLKWHGFPTMWSFQMAFLLVFCACNRCLKAIHSPQKWSNQLPVRCYGDACGLRGGRGPPQVSGHRPRGRKRHGLGLANRVDWFYHQRWEFYPWKSGFKLIWGWVNTYRIL